MSLFDGSLWANIRFGAFSVGSLALAYHLVFSSFDEPEEVKEARRIVDEHTRKDRLTRLAVWIAGCATIYGAIRVSAHIVNRQRNDGEGYRQEEMLPMEHMYSE